MPPWTQIIYFALVLDEKINFVCLFGASVCSPLLHRVLIISGHVRKALHICTNTEKASPRLCLLCLFVCLEKAQW